MGSTLQLGVLLALDPKDAFTPVALDCLNHICSDMINLAESISSTQPSESKAVDPKDLCVAISCPGILLSTDRRQAATDIVTPLYAIQLKNHCVEMTNCQGTCSYRARFSLSVNHFGNIEQGHTPCWQPAIEEFEVDARMIRDSSGQADTSIIVPSFITANITPELVASFKGVCDLNSGGVRPPTDNEVYITSHRGQQLHDRNGTLCLTTHKGPEQRWLLREADGGHYLVRSSGGLHLENRHVGLTGLLGSKVGVHADAGSFQKWIFSQIGEGKWAITSHLGLQLEDRDGSLGVRRDRGSMQMWTIQYCDAQQAQSGVTICNMLPFPLCFQGIVVNDPDPAFQGVIPAQGRCQVNGMHYRFRVDGWRWSGTVAVANIKARIPVACTDNADSERWIWLEPRMLKNHTYEIVAYAKYCVLNGTGLPMLMNLRGASSIVPIVSTIKVRILYKVQQSDCLPPAGELSSVYLLYQRGHFKAIHNSCSWCSTCQLGHTTR